MNPVTFLAAVTEKVGTSFQDMAKVSMNPLTWIPLVKFVGSTVKAVEEVCKDQSNEHPDLPGETKEEIAVRFINERVDLPLLTEAMEAELIRFIIRMAVMLFNDITSKDWGNPKG